LNTKEIDVIVDNNDLRSFQTSIRSYLTDRYELSHLRQLIKGDGSFSQEQWKEFSELGALSFFAPERLGGGCLSDNQYFDAAVVSYELGRVLYDGPFLASTIAISCLGSQNTQAADEVVEAIMSGDTIVAWAVEDADPAIPTRVDNGTVFSGKKKLVEFASESSAVLVTALSEADEVVAYIPKPQSLMNVVQQVSLDPTRRFGAIEFHGVDVANAEMFIAVNQGKSEISRLVALSILLQSAETLGLADRVFDMTLEWVNERMAFGRPIGSYQALKHRLAEHKLWLESSRGMVEGLAIALQSGDDFQELASAVKAYVGPGAVTLVQDAIQMHGGIGLTFEHNLHLYLRRATSNSVQFGTRTQHLEKLCVLMGV
jgi:alkylation response protein AidB-like acyl-CoA dehydrogenase